MESNYNGSFDNRQLAREIKIKQKMKNKSKTMNNGFTIYPTNKRQINLIKSDKEKNIQPTTTGSINMKMVSKVMSSTLVDENKSSNEINLFA